MYKYELKFKEVPPPAYAGFYNRTPFYIGLTTNDPDYENLRINFFSQNSNSAPYQQPQNKWSHLVPQWGFFDSNTNYIEFANPYCLYEKNVGGEIFYETCVSAYYVDNMPSNVIIIATLETSGLPLSSDNYEIDLPSYSNSLIYDQAEYDVLQIEAKSLKVTQDGKNPIDLFKWTSIKIPFVVTFHSDFNSSLINTNLYGLTGFDPIVFTFPLNEEFSDLSLSLDGVSNSGVFWSDTSSVKLSSLDQYGFINGGFYKGYFTSVLSSLNCKINASYSDAFYNANFLNDISFTLGFPPVFSGLWELSVDVVFVSYVGNSITFLNIFDTGQYDKKMYYKVLNSAEKLKIEFEVTRVLNCPSFNPNTFFNFLKIVVFDQNFNVIQELYSLPFDPQIQNQTISQIIEVENLPVGYLGFYWQGFNACVNLKTFNVYIENIVNQSNSFQIKPFERPYELRTFNESWDTAQNIKSYALAEHTFNNPVLFDNFMDVSVGGLEKDYQSLGRRMYERIANFVKNNSDINTCNLNQIYSMHDSIDTPIDDYRISYPSEIRRLVDLFSVKKDVLLGDFCKCNRNFTTITNKCYFCGHMHSLNRSNNYFTTQEYVVTADIPFVIENVFSTKDNYRYDLLYPSVCDLNGLQTSPMSSLPFVSWLTSANYLKYNIYDYIPSYCGEQMEGLINWNDTYTTLSSSVSTVDQLYGNNGLLEEILNYEIHRGLYNV